MSLDVSSIGSGSLFSMNTANIQNSENKSNSFQKTLENAVSSGEDQELKSACVEFESYFIYTMLKEMRKTVDSEGGLIPRSEAEKTFQDMLDQEYSKGAASGKGIGLATFLYKQLSKDTHVEDVQNDL